MENFLKCWNDFCNTSPSQSDRKPQIKKQLLEIGMNIVQTFEDIYIKEKVLQHLIFAFPKKAEFYFEMGSLFITGKSNKELLWFKLCYQLKPDHVENLIALCRVLFNNQLFLSVIEHLHNHINIVHSSVPLLHYFTECGVRLLYHKDVFNCIQLLESKVSKKETIYLNAIYNKAKIYHFLSNQEDAIKTLENLIKLSTFNHTQTIAYKQQRICLNDYFYYNPLEHYSLCKTFNDEMKKRVIPRTKFPIRTKGEKIRIGYVSGDFLLHAICNFILPILKHHNKTRFEIFLFSNHELLHPMFSEFTTYKIHKMSDLEVANLIFNMDIDILIDLSGHTANNRLEMFAHRPAPILMTYLGYPNTTGISTIQYRITDIMSNPLDSCQIYSETLLRMSRCFLLYKSVYQTTPVIPCITNDKEFILGAINREPKNTKYILPLWSCILSKNPNSKILIKLESYNNTEERMSFYKEHLGVDETRIILIPNMNDTEYNNLFSKIDIVLDTAPYSGTTTTCNALYNSIPVITLYNKDYHVHNVSASILKNAGLTEFIAYTDTEYIELATFLIQNPDLVSTYKQTIHARFMKSMEPEPFMSEYETLLFDVYKTNILDKQENNISIL